MVVVIISVVVNIGVSYGQYQPIVAGGTRSPHATLHHLQNPKWPLGGPKMAKWGWKVLNIFFDTSTLMRKVDDREKKIMSFIVATNAEVYIVQLFGTGGGGWNKTCTLGQNWEENWYLANFPYSLGKN